MSRRNSTAALPGRDHRSRRLPLPSHAASGAAADFEPRSTSPFAAHDQKLAFDPRQIRTGIVLGSALHSGSYRGQEGADHLPGDDMRLTFPTAGTPPQAVSDIFTVVDFYESKMSEYDSSFLFIPIEKLQQLRGMIDPPTGIGSFTSIQIKLKEGVDLDTFCNKLAFALPAGVVRHLFVERKARPAAGRRANGNGDSERVVVHDHRRGRLRHPGDLLHDRRREDPRYRHPEIARCLEPRNLGHLPHLRLVARMVGAGGGMVIGILFTVYINEIADLLGKLTGRPVFDPSIYYFQEIPDHYRSIHRGWIVVGAWRLPSWPVFCPRGAAALAPRGGLAL